MPDINVRPEQDRDGNLIEILGLKEQRLKELCTELHEAIGTTTRAVLQLCDLFQKMGARPSLQTPLPSIRDKATFDALEEALPMQIIRLRRLLGEYENTATWTGMQESLEPYFPRPKMSLHLQAFLDGQNAGTWHRTRTPGDTRWFELADTSLVAAFGLGFRMEATHGMGAWDRHARRLVEGEIDAEA